MIILLFAPYCGVGVEGAEKILGYLTSTFEDFLHFCGVSEEKMDQNECAEGVLIVKRPFPGSKVRNNGPDRYKSMFKISRNKKQSSKFIGYKKYVALIDPLGGKGGVSRKAKILSLGYTFLKYLIPYAKSAV